MQKKYMVVPLAFLVLVGFGILAVSRGQPAKEERPEEVKAKLEYKAIKRMDIEELAPKPVRENGQLEGSNIPALTAGLNVLAGQGWELVAIEPYWQQQSKEVKATVTFHHYPTYIFRRSK